ncbi:NAD-dependent epimerase/dehydratase family protein [Reichenbachiella sp.]|uniref:NAD-dependent epimerase/dehydratase family protein n=1 Tax=Reichenbachiella sp. TaxID=2184521 RepID=UPI003BAFE741
MNKTIAITGGTGHIGTALIELLLKEDYIVRALHHQSRPKIEHNNLTWFQGDINDPSVLAGLISGTNIVVHCAAIVSINDAANKKLFEVNVNGTKSVINTCLRTSEVRLIHISSSIVSKTRSNHSSFDESLPYRTDDGKSYDSSKIKAEKAIIEAVNKHDLDAVILRPTAVVGPPDYRPSLLGNMIHNLAKGHVPTITTGGYNMIDVRDLCKTIINSFEKARKGEIYLLSGSFCSIKKLAKLANPYKSFIAIPTQLLLATFPVVDWYLKAIKFELPVTRKSLLTLQQSPKNMCDTKAKKELNHSFRSIETTISDLVDWFNKNSSGDDDK